MKKKNGKAQSSSNQKMILFSKLKDRHGNRVGPCQRAKAIADSLHHEHRRPGPVPPTKNRCKLISSDLGMNTDILSNEEVIAAIKKNEKREGTRT